MIRQVLLEAGHELHVLNRVRIKGFGWIARTPDDSNPFRGGTADQ